MALVTLDVVIFSDSEDFGRHVILCAYISMEVAQSISSLNRGCESEFSDFNVKLSVKHDVFGL